MHKSSRCRRPMAVRPSVMSIRLSFAKVSVRLSYNFAFVLVSSVVRFVAPTWQHVVVFLLRIFREIILVLVYCVV